MSAITSLPENYKEIMILNLQSNKKQALTVNGIAMAIMLVMWFVMDRINPLEQYMDSLDFRGGIIRLVTCAVLYVLYIIAHELTHGVAMKYSGGKKVKYGFTGLYAFAGSNEDYFDKKSYVLIALAPVVTWGIIFAIAQAVLPYSWSWVVYFLQVGNVSGAAGDLYVTVKVLGLPDTIYVRDTGIDMTIYDR